MIKSTQLLTGCKFLIILPATMLVLDLSAASGRDAEPSPTPPPPIREKFLGPTDTLQGFTFFSAQPGKPIRADQLDLSRSGDKLEPIRLVAPRNGVASGQVVIGDIKPLAGISATMSDLTGPGTIPATQVKIRYLSQKSAQEMQVLRYESWQKPLGYLSDLHDTAPVAPIVPVWITISVPATAAAGDYKGTLTVKVAGRTQAVPVLLQVGTWTVPPPAQWRTHVGLSQSPDGVALHYEVPYGSPEHLRLMEESYKYLGAIGCKLAWFSMIDSQRGGAKHQGMPTYTKTAKGWVPDMTLVDKYLALHQKYCGTPQVLLVWVATGNEKTIRFKDSDGKVQEIQQETPEAEQFYKTMMDAVHASVVKRGWPESLIVLGGACEIHPDEPVVTMLKKVAPYARWSHQAHDPKLEIHGVEVGYVCFARGNPDNWKGLPWNNPRMIVNSSYKAPSTFGHPMYWRWRAESFMYHWRGPVRGFSRIGADFWTYKDKTSKKPGDTIARVEHWTGGQPTIFLSQSLPCLLAPGPRGAISTVHYEMMREGLQELEARIAIEAAIEDKTAPASVVTQWERKDKSNPSLKNRVPGDKGDGAGGSRLDWPNFDQPNWQDKVLELYQLAGESSGK